MIRAAIIAIIASLCSSCSGALGVIPIDSHKAPPEDWPKMEIRMHSVPPAERRTACKSVADEWPWFVTIESCELIRFDKRTCDIYFDDDPNHTEVHVEHCYGRDHVGSTHLADAWENYKRSKRK